MKSPFKVLSVEQVARLLRRAITTAEERTRVGDLPGLKFGAAWVFPADALQERLHDLAIEAAKERRARPHPVAISQGPRAANRLKRIFPKLPELP